MNGQVAQCHAQPLRADLAHGIRQRRDLIFGFTGLNSRQNRAGGEHGNEWMVGRQRYRIDQIGGALQPRCFVGEVRHANHLDQHPSGLFPVPVVDRLGAIEHHFRCMPWCSVFEFDTSAHPGQLGQGAGVPAERRRFLRQRRCPFQLTGVTGTHRRGGQSLAAHDRVGGEPGGALVCGRTCRVAAAAVRADGRGLHRVGGVVVETDRRRGQMPGASIGELRSGQRIGEGAVGGDAFGGRRPPVHRRPDERMSKRQDAVGQPNQPCALGSRKVIQPQPNPGQCVQNHAEFTGLLGRRNQQGRPGGLRQPIDPHAERVQHPAAGSGQRGHHGRRA